MDSVKSEKSTHPFHEGVVDFGDFGGSMAPVHEGVVDSGRLGGGLEVRVCPRSEWPDEVCEEHGGEGWRGRVTSEDRRSGSVGVKTHDHTYYFAMEAVLSWKALK